eukprot:scaffold32165_cov147-Skeletonema_marinoi.AAC.3
MKISLPLAVLLCLPVMAMANPKYHRLRKKKKGKAGKKFKRPVVTQVKVEWWISLLVATLLHVLAIGTLILREVKAPHALARSYVAESRGNTPANGNPGDNTCLAVGDAPSCFVLEGVNDDEPVLVRTSIAWDWSEYTSPSSPNSSTCGTLVPPAGPSTLNTCATILTDSSIPVVAADANTLSPPGADGTTGQCYSVNPLTGIPFAVDPGVSTITSTVTFTIEEEEYVCQVTAGGKVCEMWGYSNGYGNNFDSQYVPFRCDDIEGDAFEGYIAFVFDHYKITPVTDGIGQAPQIVLRKV